MIFEGSRYQGTPLLRVQAADGVIRPTSFGDVTDLSRRYLHHTVVDGDRMDSLAQRYFNNPLLWWYIADANPEVFYPDDLEPGTVLRIPQG